jgi:hypothetical protein
MMFLFFTACEGNKAKQGDTRANATKQLPASARTTEPTAGSAAPLPSATGNATSTATTSAPASASALLPAAQQGPFPESETKPPKPKEWDTQAQFFPVKYASTLWCETRTLREWVRVSCRARPGAANAPVGVEVTKKPSRGQSYVFSREGQVTSVVLQPRKGQSSELTFT